MCDRYVTALQQRGVDVWYDRHNIQGGQRLGKEIEGQLERRSALVVLLTPGSVASYWVDMEVSAFRDLAAHDPARLLLPVRIADCSVPLLMRGLFWVDALPMPFEQAIDTIVTALALPDVSVASARAPTSLVPPIPSQATLPTQPGPSPAPKDAIAVHHLTPMSLYVLGFRGYSVGGVECVVPPLCPVPGSVFVMGSDQMRDAEAGEHETPQYPVSVGDFSIGQYPVTVAEYACAVRARAVREPPRGRQLRIDWHTQLQRLDYPVFFVSWQDAVAYTR